MVRPSGLDDRYRRHSQDHLDWVPFTGAAVLCVRADDNLIAYAADVTTYYGAPVREAVTSGG